MTADEEFEREALRLYRRYSVEVVERFGLCPWAERARRDGHVRECVILQENWGNLAQSRALIRALEDDEQIEIALFIYPDLEVGRLAFESLVRKLRDLDAEGRELGSIPFAMAAFHPEAEPDLDDAERLIPFLRRTPDPTIQLVRRTTLDRVRERHPEGTAFVDITQLDPSFFIQEQPKPLRERIAEANLETAQSVGISALLSVLDDIREDRRQSYAKLTRRAPDNTK